MGHGGRSDRALIPGWSAPIVLLGALLWCGALAAQSGDDRRLKPGLRVFRHFLNADEDLARKTGRDGSLLVVLVTAKDQDRSELLASLLAGSRPGEKDSTISKLRLDAEATSDATLGRYRDRTIASIYVAGNLDEADLQSLVQYGAEHHIIVYSHLTGHVERGVLGGISIEAQVRPFVNRKALAASGVKLKSFFLKVVKFHE